MCARVCVQEMPGDVDYINLGRMIVPLELNYCQCMLELEEYYEVIEHMDELLEKHKGECLLGGCTVQRETNLLAERASSAQNRECINKIPICP